MCPTCCRLKGVKGRWENVEWTVIHSVVDRIRLKNSSGLTAEVLEKVCRLFFQNNNTAITTIIAIKHDE